MEIEDIVNINYLPWKIWKLVNSTVKVSKSQFKNRAFFSSSKTKHGFINIDNFTLLLKKYRMLQRNWGLEVGPPCVKYIVIEKLNRFYIAFGQIN